MRSDLAARVLAAVLKWDETQVATLLPPLQMMARLKYDEYEGYRPGERFMETLAAWLQQMPAEAHEAALRLVMESLVFVSRAELEHLIETAYPDDIRPGLLRQVASEEGIQPYRVTAIASSLAFRDLQRKTLVLGLADGARLDRLRRSCPELSHEQFYLHPELGEDSRESIRQHLVDAVEKLGLQSDARFRRVVFVDDFAGTGYTLLSQERTGNWRGKLMKAAQWLKDLQNEDIVTPDARVSVLLYVASEVAQQNIEANLSSSGLGWDLSVLQVLTKDLAVVDAEVIELSRALFDSSLIDHHLGKGGANHHLGFGELALPLVLHHNTPNNSIGLLWADTFGRPGSLGRRGLFPRRERHSPMRP